MPTQPNITAIIPSKDRFTRVQSLVENLRSQDYPKDKLQILIIDDGSQPAYRFAEPQLKVLRHEQSQGAQRSRNEGLRAATGPISLIIDDDVELLGKDFIRRAVEVFHRHPQVAAVVSRKYDVIQNGDGQTTHEFSTSRPTWYSGDLINRQRPSGPIDWGHGIYFVRREIILTAGGYDGIYGLNGGHSFREESDVHARLRKKGYHIWYLPEIAINHHVIATGGHGAHVGRRLFWIAHNHIVFLRRHLRCWPLRAVGFLFDVVRYSWVQGRFRYLFDMLRGYLAGWRNALRDRGPGLNTWLE